MRRRRFFIILAIIFIIASIAFIAMLVPHIPKRNSVEESVQAELETLYAGQPDIFPNESKETEDEADVPYVSPIDFESLKKENDDIIGWLYIPGTEINRPVLCSQTDDTYYLKHAMNRQLDVAGSLFIEHSYNSTDFSDPVTVIYGHKMRSGSMFGNLQEHFSEEFDKCRHIYLFTPDETIEYEAFAAIPYNNNHLLYYNNFTNSEVFKSFFYDILDDRKLGATVKTDGSDEFLCAKDNVLILSTCTYEYNADRYIVVAKRITR